MIGVSFAVGTEIWIRGRAARILESKNPHTGLVEFLPMGERAEFDLHRLHADGVIRWTPPSTEAAVQDRPLIDFSEKDLAEARRRQAIIEPLLAADRPHGLLEQLVAREGIGQRTVFRWLSEYRVRGLAGLIPGYKARGGRGQSRIDPEREALLQKVLSDYYLQRVRPTLRRTYEQVVLAFVERNLAPPSMKAMNTRIQTLKASHRTAAREGGKRSRDRHMVSRGRFPDAEMPLQTILVDHTPLDVHLVDGADRSRCIGRPYLTLAIDAYTRMVYGYYLSLDEPSYLSVAMCILQGALPKRDLVERYGLKQPWPIHGLPVTVHTDNGKDFTSKHLELFAQQYGIELDRRPVRVPHYGGLIERAIGTINRFTHALPGTSKSNIQERGDYKAERYATLTLEEIEEFVARRIVDHYHVESHSGLGKPPIQAWDDAISSGKFTPRLAPDPKRFFIDLLPFEERTVQKEGISLFDLTYTAGVLQTLRGVEGPRKRSKKYVVKYDPRDLSRIWLMLPGESDAHEIPLATRAAGPFSLIELRRSRALAKAEGRMWLQRELVDMLQRERRQLDEAAEKTRRDRRAAASRQRQKQAVLTSPATPKAANDLSSDPTIDSDIALSGTATSGTATLDDWGETIIYGLNT